MKDENNNVPRILCVLIRWEERPMIFATAMERLVSTFLSQFQILLNKILKNIFEALTGKLDDAELIY
jgi:hypothetical protein